MTVSRMATERHAILGPFDLGGSDGGGGSASLVTVLSALGGGLDSLHVVEPGPDDGDPLVDPVDLHEERGDGFLHVLQFLIDELLKPAELAHEVADCEHADGAESTLQQLF